MEVRRVPRVVKSNGEVVTWTATGACYCTECEELFSSEYAFEKHLIKAKLDANGKPTKRRSVNESTATHDLIRVVKNSKGIYVSELMDRELVDRLYS